MGFGEGTSFVKKLAVTGGLLEGSEIHYKGSSAHLDHHHDHCGDGLGNKK